VQHTSLVPGQSLSTAQTFKPSCAGSHTICGLESPVRTHAWPIAVSQVESVLQNFGQLEACWQMLPPDG
jgi:hypothetical protein